MAQMIFLLTISHLLLIVNAVPVTPPNATASENNAESISGYYQGDMVLPPLRGRGVGARPSYQRWTGGVVPYEFAGNISVNNTLFIEQQMRAMENLTAVNNTPCIRFRPKNSTDTVYITIYNGTGCFAPLGSWGMNPSYVRGMSLMHSPTSTCMISGTIQHELNHVLGFYHEQSRPDRDIYVSIQWSNIDPSKAFNFDKENDTTVDTLATPYDYGSVMHYGWNAFAMNSSGPTIIAVFNSSANLGQRVQLSPIDILEIQRYYNCIPTPTTTTSTTTSAPGATTTTTSTTSMAPGATTTTQTTTTSVTTSTRTTTSVTTATTTSATTATTTSATTATTTTETTTESGSFSIHHMVQSQWMIYLLSSITIIYVFDRRC